MKYKFGLSLLMAVVLTSCNLINNNSSNSDISSTTDLNSNSDNLSSIQDNSIINSSSETIYNSIEDSSWIIPSSDVEYENGWTLAELFAPSSMFSVQINMDASELMKIQNDYYFYDSFGSKSPIYRKCDVLFTLNGTDLLIPEVGIRMKGNLSRTAFLINESEFGNFVHWKLSFSETFDDENHYDNPKVWHSSSERSARKNRLFLGLEKLDMKWNRNWDSTYIKENYTYRMFRENGILAPRETLGVVSFKLGNHEATTLGAYYIIEPMDKLFIERNLPVNQQGGDLYKVGWGECGNGHWQPGDLLKVNDTCMGAEDEDTGYFPIYDIKTNKKTSTHADLKRLINFLNDSDKTVIKNELNNYVHLNQFFMLEAIAYLAGNPDDMRNNGNNYYIYFTKNDHRALFLPYDWDWTLGVKRGYNPTGNAMTKVEPYTRTKPGGQVANPIYIKTFLKEGVPEFQNQYKNYIVQLLDSKWFKDDSAFNELFAAYYPNYHNKVAPSGYQVDAIRNSQSPMQLGTHDNVEDNEENVSFLVYINLKKETVGRTL